MTYLALKVERSNGRACVERIEPDDRETRRRLDRLAFELLADPRVVSATVERGERTDTRRRTYR